MSPIQSARRVALGLAAALAITAPAAAQAHDGDWAGALKLPNGQQMRLVLHVTTAAGQATTAVLDSIDQDLSIPAAAYKVDGDKASILFMAVGGELEGQYSADNKTFTGAWKQGLALPLTLTRQDAAAPPVAKP